jgi:beta-xylosidase
MGATAPAAPSAAAVPTILRVGSTYVAASTTTSYLNLPLMTSTDLVTWTPRPELADRPDWSDVPGYNDAMAQPPVWASPRSTTDRRFLVSQWAPSLARVGGRYVAAYSAAVTLDPRTSCLGIATATDPTGPYRTASPRPLLCAPGSARGVIDPELFVDRGTPYLLWKREGSPQEILVRRMNASATRFAAGSRARVLLRPDRRWEGSTVENPSMIRHRGRYLLFYSGNDWTTRRYATGYAVCASPLGPCRKGKAARILATSGGQAGTGGADAFVDAGGRLRLVYHAFDAGYVGAGYPRRLHTARLGVAPSGRVWVVSRS